MRYVKPILCIALLALPAAYGQSRPLSLKKTTVAPLKALPVAIHPAKEKIYVSASNGATAAKTKPAQTDKSAALKVVQPRIVTSPWHFSPKFEKGGKADSVFGMMLNHRF